jgi:anti-sigma factor RsiW
MTMFCPDEERLSAWVDRGLPPVDDEAISQHLASCEECRRAVTIAFLVDRESPEALSDDHQHRLFQTVQGALARPSQCVTDERLAAWLHDGLVPAERAEVTDHLAECDDCRRTAALSRLSNSEPVSALGEEQEKRALNLVLRSAGRDAIFTFWRVAAASLLVAIAATYIAIQWTGLPSGAPATAAAPAAEGNRPGAFHLPTTDADPATTVVPPVGVPEKRFPEAPRPLATVSSPARFKCVPVLEAEGLSSPGPQRISYADVLKPKGVASVNIEGRALVVLDEKSESRLAYDASEAEAYIVDVAAGRVFIDTAGSIQSWEVRRGDRSVTLRSFRGRACAETDGKDLRVRLLKGVAEVGPSLVDAGRCVDVSAESSVTVEEQPRACDVLSQRYAEIRPRTLLVLRAAAGVDSADGPWQYSSPSRTAQPLGAVIPECADPIKWVWIELDEHLAYASDMVMSAACGGTGTKLYLWLSGWHREVDRTPSRTAPVEWSLRGLRRDMVDIVAGEKLTKIMIGVVQEGGRDKTLEVDGLEIRRVLD